MPKWRGFRELLQPFLFGPFGAEDRLYDETFISFRDEDAVSTRGLQDSQFFGPFSLLSKLLAELVVQGLVIEIAATHPDLEPSGSFRIARGRVADLGPRMENRFWKARRKSMPPTGLWLGSGKARCVDFPRANNYSRRERSQISKKP